MELRCRFGAVSASRVPCAVREEMTETVTVLRGEPVAVLRPLTQKETQRMRQAEMHAALSELKAFAQEVGSAWSAERCSLELIRLLTWFLLLALQHEIVAGARLSTRGLFDPRIYSVAGFLKGSEAGSVIVGHVATKDQVSVQLLKGESAQQLYDFRAKALPPELLLPDQQIDAPTIGARIPLPDPVKIHLLEPALTDGPTSELDDETDGALRYGAVYPLDLFEGIGLDILSVGEVEDFWIAVPPQQDVPVALGQRPQDNAFSPQQDVVLPEFHGSA